MGGAASSTVVGLGLGLGLGVVVVVGVRCSRQTPVPLDADCCINGLNLAHDLLNSHGRQFLFLWWGDDPSASSAFASAAASPIPRPPTIIPVGHVWTEIVVCSRKTYQPANRIVEKLRKMAVTVRIVTLLRTESVSRLGMSHSSLEHRTM